MRIFVAGAGAWGTALAMLLDENGHAVTLWTRNAEKAREIDVTRQNPALAGVTLPPGIRVTAELAEAEDAELVLYAVPSFALRETAQAIAPHLPAEAILVSATKGIERSTNARMTEIIAEYAGAADRCALWPDACRRSLTPNGDGVCAVEPRSGGGQARPRRAHE